MTRAATLWLTLAGGTLAVVAPAALAPASLAAQSDPRLLAAVRQAQEGQGDSARAVVRQLLSRTPASDTLYPQILYTAAMVAPDASEMRRHLQRVTVEYSASAWADDASLRLAQLDYAGRDLEGAERDLDRIRQDYPDSPLFAQAAYWGARVSLDRSRLPDACAWIADGLPRVGRDLELKHQLEFLDQRCNAAAASPDTASLAPAAPADSDRAPAVSPAPAAPTEAPPIGARVAPRFRVQIAAVGSEAAARDAERKATALGLPSRRVQEDGLWKVRVGDYPTRADAQAAAVRLKTRLGGDPFVVAEQ